MDIIVDANAPEKRNLVYFFLISTTFAFKKIPRQRRDQDIRGLY